MYHSHIISDNFLIFPTKVAEREHLLGINVSWFEATEIQDMKTRITLQHLDIKVCIHPQQIGLLHLYKHLSSTVSEFLYRKTQLEIQECYE